MISRNKKGNSQLERLNKIIKLGIHQGEVAICNRKTRTRVILPKGKVQYRRIFKTYRYLR